MLTNIYVSGTILFSNYNHCTNFLRDLCFSPHADEKTEAECAYVTLFKPYSVKLQSMMVRLCVWPCNHQASCLPANLSTTSPLRGHSTLSWYQTESSLRDAPRHISLFHVSVPSWPHTLPLIPTEIWKGEIRGNIVLQWLGCRSNPLDAVKVCALAGRVLGFGVY